MNTIQSLLKQSTSTLLSLLDDMFASCDDLYFDLASSATSNQEQNLYFESMREVRVRASGAKQAYQKSLENGFNQLSSPGCKSDSQKIAEEAKSLEEMALLDDEQTERDVTLTAMISRARAISKSSLHEIESRLKQLLPANTALDEEKNPIDPGQLIQEFAASVDDMGLEIKPRIILYKQFERIVVKRLPEFYRNVNKKLDEAGAKYERGSSKRANPVASNQTLDSAVAGLEEGESLVSPYNDSIVQIPFGELSGLLRQQQLSPSARIPLFTSSKSGPPIQSQELLNLLDSGTPNFDDPVEPFDLRTFVSQALVRAKKKGQNHSVEQVDEDVINLVAMFFDFALEDEDIPDTVKALLSRLQMPTLKVALKDNSFFSDAKHPCREFINRVAKVSIGLTVGDRESDVLLENIENWIHDIQASGNQVEQAFDTALAEIDKYLKKVEKRSHLVEKRTSEAAEGEATKQVAKLKAQQAIHEMLDNKQVEVNTSRFIVDHWQLALYSAYLRYGEESNEWTSSLQVMQDLVWCAQEHGDDEKSSKRLQRIIEDLEARTLEGLKLTALSEDQAAKKAAEVVAQINEFQSKDDAGDANEENGVDTEVFNTSRSAELDLINENTEQPKDWESMSALERQKYQHEQATMEFIEKASAVALGSWVEFKVPETGHVIRCKLATKIDDNRTYIFVNRLGFKSVEKNLKEFAYDMQKKRARLLRSGPFFDRSLSSMIGSLRRST